MAHLDGFKMFYIQEQAKVRREVEAALNSLAPFVDQLDSSNYREDRLLSLKLEQAVFFLAESIRYMDAMKNMGGRLEKYGTTY